MYKLEKANIPSEELGELGRLIASLKWRDATTYPPDMQHAYILRKDVPEAFATLKKAIEKYGFMDEFAGKPQVYLVIGEYKYWSYDTVLNREDVQLTVARQEKAGKSASYRIFQRTDTGAEVVAEIHGDIITGKEADFVREELEYWGFPAIPLERVLQDFRFANSTFIGFELIPEEES